MRFGVAALWQLLAVLPICHGGGWTSVRGGQYYGSGQNAGYQDPSKAGGYGPPLGYPPQQYPPQHHPQGGAAAQQPGQQPQQQQQPPQQQQQPRGGYPPEGYGAGSPGYGGQYGANNMQLMPARPSPSTGGFGMDSGAPAGGGTGQGKGFLGRLKNLVAGEDEPANVGGYMPGFRMPSPGSPDGSMPDPRAPGGQGSFGPAQGMEGQGWSSRPGPGGPGGPGGPSGFGASQSNFGGMNNMGGMGAPGASANAPPSQAGEDAQGGFFSKLKKRVFRGEAQSKESMDAVKAADAALFPWMSDQMSPSSTPIVTPFDSHIACIMRPSMLEHKRRLVQMDGGRSLQVLARFERVLQPFKVKGSQTTPAMSTRDLVENTNLLWHTAQSKIAAVKRDEAMQKTSNGTAETAYANDVNSLLKVEKIIAQEGGLYPSNMVQAVSQNSDKLALRRGTTDLIKTLTWRGVPLTILTPGWAPVATEVLRQTGGVAGPSGMMPPNIAVAGNFFQIASNGIVVGFSPPITETACNASTAAALLGGAVAQSIRSRPNVIALADSPESLKKLVEGVPPKTRICIGFLEVDEQFNTKLPRYLDSFDVVLIGDASMAYVTRLVESMLGLHVEQQQQQQQQQPHQPQQPQHPQQPSYPQQGGAGQYGGPGYGPGPQRGDPYADSRPYPSGQGPPRPNPDPQVGMSSFAFP